MYKPWSLQVPRCCWQPLLSRFIITSAGSCFTLPGGRFHTINSFLEHIWIGHFFLLDLERLSFVSVLSESPSRYWSFRSLAQVVSISPVLPLSSCILWSSSYNGTQWTNHSVSRSFSSKWSPQSSSCHRCIDLCYVHCQCHHPIYSINPVSRFGESDRQVISHWSRLLLEFRVWLDVARICFLLIMQIGTN